MSNGQNNVLVDGLSYYGLSLLSFLLDSHPDLASDSILIRSRADRAAEAYCQAIRNGESRSEADAQAARILYQGLHFSLYNTIVNILWDEFQDLVPEEEARTIARDILPHAAFLKQEYDLNDD
ncbi:protein containing DUF1896, partial [human gut metagenome]